MRSAALTTLLIPLWACSSPEPPQAGNQSPEDRGALYAGPAEGKSGTLASADPAALAELLAAAPDAGRAPTGEDGRTRIGTDTGLPELAEDPRPPEAPDEPQPPRVSVGPVKIQGSTSSPGIEKAARAQLYWSMVQRCRGPDGKLLPPDAVTLSFNIDPDGYIVPSTILAHAMDPRHEEAAACMRKELSGATFRAPPGARGQLTRVEATVPSVD